MLFKTFVRISSTINNLWLDFSISRSGEKMTFTSYITKIMENVKVGLGYYFSHIHIMFKSKLNQLFFSIYDRQCVRLYHKPLSIYRGY